MPETKLRAFKDTSGEVPFVIWIDNLRRREAKAAKKCLAAIELLKDFGHELRRPHADYLRDGVFELRVRFQSVNYRILYGFVGSNLVLVSHGLTKEKKVPPAEIEKAVKRLALYQQDPDNHFITLEEI